MAIKVCRNKTRVVAKTGLIVARILMQQHIALVCGMDIPNQPFRIIPCDI